VEGRRGTHGRTVSKGEERVRKSVRERVSESVCERERVSESVCVRERESESE
jgi:hypothetical protein